MAWVQLIMEIQNLILVIPGLHINPTNMEAMDLSNLFYDISELQKAKKKYN